ncbi:MAG TPA: ribonuclease P protein component [Candidatus Saccharimonadales bacterium]|nr:ribonuclease P protein component [Candidatus Saccharimonadales bacterium]
MLAAKYRFHGYGALKYLFGHGKTWRFKSVSLRVAPNPRRANSRIAVVISKKVIKAAPKRNRVRRRVYELLRIHWPHIKPSHDVVLTVYDPGVLDAPHDQLEAEIIDALQRSHLWTETKSTKTQD